MEWLFWLCSSDCMLVRVRSSSALCRRPRPSSRRRPRRILDKLFNSGHFRSHVCLLHLSSTVWARGALMLSSSFFAAFAAVYLRIYNIYYYISKTMVGLMPHQHFCVWGCRKYRKLLFYVPFLVARNNAEPPHFGFCMECMVEI